ncbi:STE like transcription factor-domain-containing protein [Mycena alexandri]|uniref:STE like transcription factor-domain-containing protein n=1 Tax=Mycena alexandri TaxID=1745969 RepID=A0AAD6TIW6_9AGAR|nr:STE like transcription factor-domain-containing protein [Mycena alexandri]
MSKSLGLSRPLPPPEAERLAYLDRLKFFLLTAPSRWDVDAITLTPHPAINRFLLPTQEYVSCVLWNGLYHITGTDIIRALVSRFDAFGRPVRNLKKFEEGVFMDLRALKPGADACLEEPKSPFLELLFRYQCIRTQTKQKVYYWFSVAHDRLFLDALGRDLKREKMGLEPSTQIVGEPALSFVYDGKKSLDGYGLSSAGTF